MNVYLESLGESVLEALRTLHSQYDGTGATRDKMLAVFGFPRQCLVCAKPLLWMGTGDISNDVDPWFCSDHCPICETSIEYEVTA